MPLAPLLVCLAASAAPTPPRTDLHGDPLPAGALVRFGTVRLRHAGLSDFVSTSNGTALTAGDDKVLRHWDLASGKQTRSVALAGAGGAGRVVTLSPDGKTLVAHRDSLLVFWDAVTGKELARLPRPAGQLSYLYFSPDGDTLADGAPNGDVVLREWRANKQRTLAVPRPERPGMRFQGLDSTTHCAFSPDGRWLLAQSSSNEPLGVFDLASGRLAHKIPCHAHTFTVSPDSKTFAVESWMNDKGDRQSSLRFFDLATGKEVKCHPLKGEPRIFCLAFSPDGKQLACGRSDEARVVEVASGRELFRLTEYPSTLTYTPDGKRLLASTGYGLRVWDAATMKELHDRGQPIGRTLAVAVSPDGATIAVADWMDQAVSLWDAGTGRLRSQIAVGGMKRYVRDLAFSPDGKAVTGAQAMGHVQTWEVGSGREARSVQLAGDGQGPARTMFAYRLHAARDGRTISTVERASAGGGEASRLTVRDLQSGKVTHELTVAGEQRSCAWHAGGKSAAVFTGEGLILVDVERGAKRLLARGTRGGQLGWSIDQRLVAGTTPGRAAVRIWEAATGGEIATVKTGPADHFAVVPGGRFLITTDAEALRVWDLATGRECGRRALATAASALLVTPDGERAFTALGDGTGLVWDLTFATGRGAPGRPPDAEALAAWWGDLAGRDAGRAFAAAWCLADLPPGEAVAFLRARLRPAGELDAKAVSKHIEDLDSDDFATRQKASSALEALGPAAAPALRSATEKTPSLEVKRRLRALLDKADDAEPPPELLRQARALFALESLQHGAGRPLLVELSKGAPNAPLTQAAKEALERMSR